MIGVAASPVPKQRRTLWSVSRFSQPTRAEKDIIHPPAEEESWNVFSN